MPEKDELGRRIKKVREDKQLTLKAIEASAGISATHVSEIERGKTSPTLGALLRIASALGKDPAYFIEDEDLGDTSLVAREDRVRESLPEAAGTIEELTTCIPGGRLRAAFVSLEPGKGPLAEAHTHPGDEAMVVLSGSVRVELGEGTTILNEGDSIHYSATDLHTYANASPRDPASLIWISTARRNS